MICHCGSEMTAHGDENPFKIGAHHCDSCSCCLLEDGSPRAGHNPCAAFVPSPGEALTERAVVESPPPLEARPRRRRRKI